MGAKFHTTRSGDIAPCKATERACPLGEENHFASPKEAAQAFMGSSDIRWGSWGEAAGGEEHA